MLKLEDYYDILNTILNDTGIKTRISKEIFTSY